MPKPKTLTDECPDCGMGFEARGTQAADHLAAMKAMHEAECEGPEDGD